MTAWQDYLVTDRQGIDRMLTDVRTVAVLGIRSEKVAQMPTHYVPAYLVRAGLTVIPVPVYEPNAVKILGQPVYRTLAEIPGNVDLVDVFRRPDDIPAHLDDILAKKPKAVWFQSGIVNHAAAEQLAKAGIQVVQDHCLMVEHRRFTATGS